MTVSVEIKRKFDQRAADNKRIFENRKEALLSEFPEIDIYYSKLDKISLDQLKGLIDEEKADELSRKAESDLSKYLEDRGHALSEMTYRPICGICNDTGYTNNHICNCLINFSISENSKTTPVNTILEKENFSSFDLELFSKEKGSDNRSPYDVMTKNRDRCMKYAEDFGFSPIDNLLISGKPGTGKSFLTHCIAKELIEKGFSVVYRSAYSLIEAITKDHIGETDGSFTDSVYNADLLIIDDLGTERQTDFSEMQLYNLINERISGDRPMIISTNLTASEINNRYGERIVSRLFGNFSGMRMHGEDVRLKLKKGISC